MSGAGARPGDQGLVLDAPAGCSGTNALPMPPAGGREA